MVWNEDIYLIHMKKIGLKVLFVLMCSPRARDKELKHIDEFLNGPQFLVESIASTSIQEIADKTKNKCKTRRHFIFSKYSRKLSMYAGLVVFH